MFQVVNLHLLYITMMDKTSCIYFCLFLSDFTTSIPSSTSNIAESILPLPLVRVTILSIFQNNLCTPFLLKVYGCAETLLLPVRMCISDLLVYVL